VAQAKWRLQLTLKLGMNEHQSPKDDELNQSGSGETDKDNDSILGSQRAVEGSRQIDKFGSG
jgi:hypothetical protein